MVTGDILLKRMHDHTADLPGEVERAVGTYLKRIGRIGLEVTEMRETEIPPALASEILMDAGRQGIVGWAAVGRVDAEYRAPTFGEHGKHNAWALLNAFTYTTRNSLNPTRQMDAYRDFKELILNAAALAA
jgi:hypothetical protein